MDPVSQALIDAIQNNKPAALATVVKTRGVTPREAGAKMLVYPDGKIVGTVGGSTMELRVITEARAVIREGKPRYLELTLADDEHGAPREDAGAMEIFVEPLSLAPTLVIVGAGHVGAAVAQLAKPLGFRITVLDDRVDFVTPDNFPHADERIAGDLVEKIRDVEITPQTYVVIVTRNHALDPELLGAIVEKDAAYIGMLGSARRAATVMDTLKQRGISVTALARVHAPIGIEINAETPQEIAVSIMAEIIQVQRKK
ncbi:putative xanthine dehydrogenase subunit A [Anaerolineae bacterium]|nr:putative xanthine dehydrogenase subunit A [Anaerolineae bacterium]